MSALCLAASAALHPAQAAPAPPWQALADRTFRPVAENADIPNALVPVSMVEGPDGFLWMAGDAGLVRWDGYQFRDFHNDPTRPGDLRGTEITVLFPDRAGRLWGGTTQSGLVRFDPALGRMVCVPVLAPKGCDGTHVLGLQDDGAGGLWAATDSALLHVDADSNLILQAQHEDNRPTSLPDSKVLAVLHDHQGVVWAGTRLGLARSFDGGRNFQLVKLTADPQPAVSLLKEDSTGRIWIGSRQHGAFMIDAYRGPARSIPASAPNAQSDTAIEINTIEEQDADHVWLGTDGHGILVVDANTLESVQVRHDPFVPAGLSNDSIQALYRDRAGLIWVANGSSISTFDTSGSGIATLVGAPQRNTGLPSDNPMALLSRPDGGLWIGFQGGGYAIIDTAGRRAAGLGGHTVFALAPVRAGQVLMGTDDGLFLADGTGHSLSRVQVPGLRENAQIPSIFSIGDYVFLAGREDGVWQFRMGTDNRLTLVRHYLAPQLTHSVVISLGLAPDGRLAVGTISGLNLIDGNTGVVERILGDPVDPAALRPGYINAAGIDGQHRLWLGTVLGVDVMIGRDAAGRPRFRHIGAAEGLPQAAVDALQVDRHGMMWVTTDRGLAVIDPHDFSVRRFGRAEGSQVTNYWAAAAVELPDGELAFGGIGGMSIVNPDAMARWSYHPPVVVTAARTGGHSVSAGTTLPKLIEVQPEANSLSVEFASLDYSAPAQNRYAYRLEGFDAGWMETDAAHRVANYTNLPPGDYKLRLRGTNRDGVWTTPDTVISVRVIPAWFQTLWFKTCAVGISALLALFGMLRWTEVLRSRQRALENQVAARTAELSESQIQLQQINAELEMRVNERTQALAERSAALEASEARLRTWFNLSEDGMFLVRVHADGRFSFEALNPAIERIFAVEPGTGLGRGPHDILPAEIADVVVRRYREAMAGEPIHYESRYVINGVERLLDTWIAPLREAASGNVVRLVGSTRDQTDRRALEARLAQAQKLQALGGLAGGIAHDFNNILQAVAGAAMLMEQRPEEPEKILRLARSTIAAAERGTSITKRLLAFARSDSLSVEAIPTTDVLEGVLEVLKYSVGNAVALKSQLQPGLPPVLADRGQLETALVNLGTNARDAMPRGGVLTLAAARELVREGQIHIAGLAPGAYVRIDLIDTGTGMDAATLARAVEPFFTTKPQGQGTGLGLALVKGFAEQSGGQMSIESRPGRGTTVSLWLRDAGAAALRPPVDVPARLAAHGGTARILVVDDDTLVRDTIAEQLEDAGFEVLQAEGGREALAMIEAGASPDAMVCDLSMPGMDGEETIRRARVLLPRLNCFLLTGYAGDRAMGEGAAPYTLLRKPISSAELVSQIETALTAVQA